MGSKYEITGVQLGMLIAIPDMDERKKLVEGIIGAPLDAIPIEKAVSKVVPKPQGEKATKGQQEFIINLQKEGYIPEDMDSSNLSKEEANHIIKLGINKRDKGVEY